MSENTWEELGSAASEPDHKTDWSRITQNLAVIIAIFAASIILALLLPRQSFLGGLEEWSRDIRIALATPSEPQDENIVIVGVDDDTLYDLTYRLPVDRSFLASIVRKLDKAGARAVGIDFLLDSDTEPEKDEDLRRALHDAKVPVIPIWADEEVGTVGERMTWLRWFVGDLPTGYGMLMRERMDGTVRYHFPYWKPDGDVKWQFPAAVARAVGVDVQATATPQRIDWHGRPAAQKGDDIVLPFAMYPAYSVQFLGDEYFKDKIVLIGPFLEDIDRHRTPFSTASERRIGKLATPRPGVEIHAHILSQLIESRSLELIPIHWELIYVAFMALAAMTLALFRLPMFVNVILSVALISVVIGGTVYVYAEGGPMVPVLAPVLAFALAATMTIVFSGRRERNLRLMVRRAFAHYVPEAIVERLDKDPSRLRLGGERREITLIFSDIAGFTTLSETISPHVLSDLVNGYLEGVGSTILEYGGTIDKFIGDGTMSFFGAPESAEDDAARAVACALKMVTFSESFREQVKAQNLSLGRTRIGIHTGTAIVGNFGGRTRFDYTALGDVVNTAARLEAANKAIGTSILVSDDTVRRALEHDSMQVAFRPVGRIVLMGKQIPLMVHTPIPQGDPDPDFFARYTAFYDMVHREDPRAEEVLNGLLRERPDDPLVKFYKEQFGNGERTTLIVLKSK